MKLKWSWIISYAFFIVIVLFFGTIFIHTSLAWWFNTPIVGLPNVVPNNVGLGFASFLMFVICPLIFWMFYSSDAAYEEKVKVGIDKFEIHDYYNIVTITLKRDKLTWVLYKSKYRKLKVEDLEYISGTNYFNKNGKFLTFTLNIRDLLTTN